MGFIEREVTLRILSRYPVLTKSDAGPEREYLVPLRTLFCPVVESRAH